MFAYFVLHIVIMIGMKSIWALKLIEANETQCNQLLIHSTKLKEITEENERLKTEKAKLSKDFHDTKDKNEDLKYELSERDKKLALLADAEVWLDCNGL